MRLAISNIAWDVAEDEQVATLLDRHGVDAIDVAPGKYFPVPGEATPADVARVRRWWGARGIEITGIQSLLYGTSGLNLFGPPATRSRMLEHLEVMCHIAAGLGATRLVFGSPRNRDRSGLEDATVQAIATEFFQELGVMAARCGLVVCLEPNPPCYGANFMTTTALTAAMVRAVGHPGIKMQLDSGAMIINGESPSEVVGGVFPIVGHVHVSEPNLDPIGDVGTPHNSIAAALRGHLANHVITLEMLATRNEPHLASIKRSLVCAIENYRNVGALP